VHLTDALFKSYTSHVIVIQVSDEISFLDIVLTRLRMLINFL
jgi:hypothetical protein